MYQIDFEKPERVHFIGIGGISMSGLAEILLDHKFPVSGSDSHRSDLTSAWSSIPQRFIRTILNLRRHRCAAFRC